MRIIVTGGAGFIGSHIAENFLASGHSVGVFDNFSSGNPKYVPTEAELFVGDIEDRGRIKTVLMDFRPDLVVHCAAQINIRTSVSAPISDAQTNIIGSLNLLEESVGASVRKVIFISTGGAMYGDEAPRPTPETVSPAPTSPYAIAKLSIDHYLRFYQKTHGLRTMSLRLANVYGPRQNPKSEAGVVAIFLEALLRGETPVIYGDGMQTRDFIYVEDVVCAVEKAIEHFDTTGIYNIGTGQEATVLDVYTMLRAYFPHATDPSMQPAREGEKRYSSLNTAKATDLLAWKPLTPLPEGIALTVKWAQAQ